MTTPRKRPPTRTSRASSDDAAAAPMRIVGAAVAPLLPKHGPVHVLLVGEAPGPRGADKSGIPFFGDAAGKHLYEALRTLGAIELPTLVDELPWDGAVFAAQQVHPVARGVALGNAFDRCPTDNGRTFRAPTRGELEGDENLGRLRAELMVMRARGLRGVVTMGRVAARTLDIVLDSERMQAALPDLLRCAVPHPSAQGLLSMAPDRGRGARMADLQAQWRTMLGEATIAAGFPAPSGDRNA